MQYNQLGLGQLARHHLPRPEPILDHRGQRRIESEFDRFIVDAPTTVSINSDSGSGGYLALSSTAVTLQSTGTLTIGNTGSAQINIVAAGTGNIVIEADGGAVTVNGVNNTTIASNAIVELESASDVANVSSNLNFASQVYDATVTAITGFVGINVAGTYRRFAIVAAPS